MNDRITVYKSKLSRFELAFLIIVSIVTITFVSTSSPLYPFNPWDDVNVFFTMGRGIIHGLVPYKDIFDHKGPVLYFIYTIAALISERSFIGVWIIECIAASVFAIFSWKIVKLYTLPSKASIMVMPVFLGIVYTVKMFNFGGNTEELCFPLLSIAFYIGLRAVVEGDGLPVKHEALICGLISGILFWIKYTFLGFMIGFCIYILVISIKHKDAARLWSLVWRFLTGFIIITIPVLLYFLITGSLQYMYDAYFYINIFLYQNNPVSDPIASIPVIRNIYIPIRCLSITNLYFPAFGVLLFLTMISILFTDKKHRNKTILLSLLTFVFSSVFIFTRLQAIYYYGYILTYGFGLSVVLVIRLWNLTEKAFKNNPGFIRILLSLIFTIFFALSLFLCKNRYLFMQPKTVLAQFLMADTIDRTPDAKLLTYDVMDAGFYTAAELLPSNKYCADKQFDDNYPLLREEQDRLISEGYFDYIVTSYFCEAEWDNYELIQEEAVPYIDYTGEEILDGYKLYKKI